MRLSQKQVDAAAGSTSGLAVSGKLQYGDLKRFFAVKA